MALKGLFVFYGLNKKILFKSDDSLFPASKFVRIISQQKSFVLCQNMLLRLLSFTGAES